MPNEDSFQKLEARAHLDLTKRARGGIIMYLLIWLILSFWAGIWHQTPLFFAVNTALFVIVASMRLVHNQLLKQHRNLNTPAMYKWLIGMVLFSAAHWGLMSAWIIFFSPFQQLHYPTMIILAAFAMGGGSVLSISRTIRIVFPILTFLPTFIVCLTMGGTEYYILAALIVASTIYILEASRVSGRDYWSAIRNKQLADDNAALMEKQLITDPLTQIHNRMYFNQRYDIDWNHCDRQYLPMSVLLLDIDHFKKLNDTYGHLAGDECLRQIARILEENIRRQTDSISRYGGEEFVVLMPDSNHLGAMEQAEKLRAAIADSTLEWHEHHLKPTCSVGVATLYPSRDMDSEILLTAADKALYKAKAQGRNRIVQAKLEPHPIR